MHQLSVTQALAVSPLSWVRISTFLEDVRAPLECVVVNVIALVQAEVE